MDIEGTWEGFAHQAIYNQTPKHYSKMEYPSYTFYSDGSFVCSKRKMFGGEKKTRGQWKYNYSTGLFELWFVDIDLHFANVRVAPPEQKEMELCMLWGIDKGAGYYFRRV